MDVTPLVPKGRQLIQSYGDNGFRVSGNRYEGSVWILPEQTLAWPVSSIAEVSPDSLKELIALSAQHVRILLIGTGKTMLPLPASWRAMAREADVALEPMDTGAACRTYNVLLTEERSVAAALIAVG
jgi:uncharacterized protein